LGSVFGLFLAELDPWGLARGAVEGFLIAFLIVAFEIGYANAPAGRWLRRLPMFWAVLIKAAVYAILIVGGDTVAGLVLSWTPAGGILQFNITFVYVMLFSLSGAIIANFVIAVNRMLGAGALASFFTGRYHRPREEQRIFLFLDLVGSTGLAERMGPVAFHAFLNEVIFDLTAPILENGGEIHRYVGDEVIATWRLSNPERNARPLYCYDQCLATLSQRAGQYRTRFGAAPAVRAAFHAGPVVVGEMGDYRREITMLGDVVNTTARIEQACRDAGKPAILSGTLMDALALPPEFGAEPLGPMPLRGKSEAIDLYALTRTPAGPPAAAHTEET
jgi:adenylate cyclase